MVEEEGVHAVGGVFDKLMEGKLLSDGSRSHDNPPLGLEPRAFFPFQNYTRTIYQILIGSTVVRGHSII